MSYADHIKSSNQVIVRCTIITLSDTRTLETDVSGKKIAEFLSAAAMVVVDHRVIADDPNILQNLLVECLAREEVDAILTTGGTGISQRDQTISVVEKLIAQPLPGFGELFRSLSYQQIGSGAMLSRAIAGITQRKLIFAMPGSPSAVELAMTKLILPEIKHLLHQLRK